MVKRALGIDFDDVIADFNAGLFDYHNKKFGTNYSRNDITAYELSHVWRCSPEEANRRIYDFYHSEEHLELHPMPGAVEALERLQEEYVLYLITFRPASVKELTEKWIHHNKTNVFEASHFLGRYHDSSLPKKTKGEICKSLGLDFFIDDSLTHAISVSQEGIPVLLFDAPWNQGKLPPKVKRISGWKEVLATLLPIHYSP